MSDNALIDLRKAIANPQNKERIAFAAFRALGDGVRSDATDKSFSGILFPRDDPRTVDIAARNNAPYNTCMLFDYNSEDNAYYAIGDLHGDIDSFIACVDAAVKNTPPGKQTVVIILGDMIDRGGCSADCIAYLLLLALGKDKWHLGVKVLFVKGDHDVALEIREDGCLNLTQRTNHSEFFDSINVAGKRCSPDAALAYAFVRFLDTYSPSSAYFSNGIFFAHGAVPHFDLQMRFGLDLTLWSMPCAQDFEWSRLAHHKRKSEPFRGSKTNDVGQDAFRSFFDSLKSLSTWQNMAPVSVFIHGHEHPIRGYKEDDYDGGYKVYTISSFREMNDDGALAETPIASLLALVGDTGTTISLINPFEPKILDSIHKEEVQENKDESIEVVSPDDETKCLQCDNEIHDDDTMTTKVSDTGHTPIVTDVSAGEQGDEACSKNFENKSSSLCGHSDVEKPVKKLVIDENLGSSERKASDTGKGFWDRIMGK